MSDPEDEVEQLLAVVARTTPGLLVGLVATRMLQLRDEGWSAEDLDYAVAAMCERLGVSEAEVRNVMAQEG